ncbi:MAG: rod shape-determining protein RodA [Alphaproteobacteria bacterium]|nr:rod shape-determining protein RodA [Alphaproteobacteria bacterium]
MFHVSSVRFKDTISWPIAGTTLAIALLGIMMMISAGGGEWGAYAAPQFLRLLPALAGMFALAFIPLRLLLRYSYLIYALIVVVLIGVDVAGHIGMGAQRWLKVGMFNVQPSEFMKLALILALARYFHQLQPEDIRRFNFLIPPLVMIVVPAIFILRQPNLGTTVILVLVGVSLLFLAGLQWRYIIASALAALAAAPVAWHFLHDYQKRRVITFLDPEKDPLGAGYNILQSMIAIGSGGFFGKGYLQGSQGQLDFLPEKQTDFIFTMLAEEMGFVGGMVLLCLYMALIWMSFTVALRSKSTFGAMIAAGVGMSLFIHMMINCAMVMGIIPVVGVPLPLLSYGGSVTVSTLLAIGLLLNAYAHRNQLPTREKPVF